MNSHSFIPAATRSMVAKSQRFVHASRILVSESPRSATLMYASSLLSSSSSPPIFSSATSALLRSGALQRRASLSFSLSSRHPPSRLHSTALRSFSSTSSSSPSPPHFSPSSTSSSSPFSSSTCSSFATDVDDHAPPQPSTTFKESNQREASSRAMEMHKARQQHREHEEQSSSSSSSSSSDSSSSSSTFSYSPLFLLRQLWLSYLAALKARPMIVQSLTSASLFAVGDISAQYFEHSLDEKKWLAEKQKAQEEAMKRSKSSLGEQAECAIAQPPCLKHDLLHHHALHLVEHALPSTSSASADHSSPPPVFVFNPRRLLACTLFGLCLMGPVGNWWYSRLDVFVNRYYRPRSVRNIASKVALDTVIFNPLFLVAFFTSVSLMEGLTLQQIKAKLHRDFVPSYVVDCSVWPAVQCLNFRFVPVHLQLFIVNIFCYFDDVFLSYVQHSGLPAIFVGVEDWWLEYTGLEKETRGHASAAPASPSSSSSASSSALASLSSSSTSTSVTTSSASFSSSLAAACTCPSCVPRPSM